MSRTEEERACPGAVGMLVRLARVAGREFQDALAQRAGVSRVLVRSVERGDHAAGLLTYARLTHPVGVPLAELLDGLL